MFLHKFRARAGIIYELSVILLKHYANKKNNNLDFYFVPGSDHFDTDDSISI